MVHHEKLNLEAVACGSDGLRRVDTLLGKAHDPFLEGAGLRLLVHPSSMQDARL